MDKENKYSKPLSYKSDEELKELLQDNRYAEDAKLAAAWELEKRNSISNDELTTLTIQVETKKQETDIEKNIRQKKLQKALENMPMKVKVAGNLVYCRILLTFLHFIILQVGFAGVEFGVSNSVYIGLLGSIIWSIILGKSIFAGAKWPRVIISIFFVISLIYSASLFPSILSITYFLGVNILFLILNLVIIYLLFSREANQWYKTGMVAKEHTLDQVS